MVIKRSIKKNNKRRRRRSRNLQKGAGYSFKLDNSHPGGVAEVTTYNNCGPSKAELSPPENSQLAPPGQAPVEVVGVSNDNLASLENTQQAQQNTLDVVQQKQTGGKRRRKSRKSRKNKRSLKNKRRNSRRRRRRRRRHQGGNCPNLNIANKEFGCKQPLWNSKCI